MNYEIIKKEICKWDPIDLLNHSPSDEYDIEIKEILSKFRHSTKENGIIIYDIFSKAFGTTFNKSVDECINIAEKIMESPQDDITV